jgi:hypothetical protein
MDSLTHHLTAKRRKFLAYRIIGQVMQRDTVPAAVLNSERHDSVAGFCIGISKRRQRHRLFGRGNQLDGYRSLYHIVKNMPRLEENQTQQPSVALLSLHAMKDEISRSKI